MKKHHFLNFGLILIFCFTITNQSLKAQQTVPCNSVHWLYLQIKQNATFPQFCQCVDFIHACTGKPAIIKGQVHNRCGNGPKYCYEVNGSTVCNTLMCELGNTRMAIHADNWDVCGQIDQDPCKVLVSQYLPLNPAFNGQLIGNWPFFSSASYPLNLNEPSGAEVFNFCPGENAVLTFPGMEIPKESGLCLVVNILSGTGAIIASQTYDYSDINNSEVNITDLMATLTPGTYQYEFILTCCEGDAALCVFNNSNKYTKKAWFKIEGEEMEFTAQLNQGGGPFSNCPQIAYQVDPNPYGPIFDPNCDINLSFFNIINNGNQSIAITVNRIIDCDLANGLNLINTYNTQLPHNGNYSIPIPNNPGNGCNCYEIVFNYVSCGNHIEEKYYYQVGGDCGEDFNGENQQLKLNRDLINNSDIMLYPNPVENYFKLEIMENQHETWNIEIFNSDGTLMKNTKAVFFGTQSEKISLKLPPGMYFYMLHEKEEKYMGKFIVK